MQLGFADDSKREQPIDTRAVIIFVGAAKTSIA
jgi:hypothetical protein